MNVYIIVYWLVVVMYWSRRWIMIFICHTIEAATFRLDHRWSFRVTKGTLLGPQWCGLSQSPILLSTSLRAQEPDLWEAGSQGQLNGTVDGEVDVSWLWWNLFSLWARLFILDVYFTEALLSRAGRVWLLLPCTCHCLYLHVARIHACWWYLHVYFLHSSFTLIFLFAGTQLPTARG